MGLVADDPALADAVAQTTSTSFLTRPHPRAIVARRLSAYLQQRGNNHVSIESIALTLHHSRSAGTDKLVLIGIANHDNDAGSFPSIATLARYANVSERSVQRSIARLVELGEVIVHTQDGGNHHTDPRYRTNRYELLVECPPDCDRTKAHRRGRGVTPTSSLAESRGDARDDRGVTPATPRGDADDVQGVTPTSPKTRDITVSEPREGTLPIDVPSTKRATSIDDRFEAWWTEYPRKVGKPAALTAFAVEVKRRRHNDVAVFEGMRVWVEFWTASGTELRFIPHPSTFLRQQRYIDQPPPVESPRQSGGKRANPARVDEDRGGPTGRVENW